MAKYALLVGINYLNTANELAGCVDDVQDMKKHLLSSRGYIESNIVMMSDDKTVVTDQSLWPNKENIIVQLKKIVGKLVTGDTFFWHYSGHGTTTHLSNEEFGKLTGQDECIVPVDLNLIVDDEVRDVVINKIPKGAKFRGIFDSCFSGTITDLPYQWKNGEYCDKEAAPCDQSDDCINLSGCNDHQTSADTYEHGENCGAMTWATLSCLQHHPNITWRELISVIRYKLVKHKYQQIPQLNIGRTGLIDEKVDI